MKWIPMLIAAGLLMNAALARASDGHAWQYSGEDGPAHWGNLTPAFALCKLGKEQSPVDIRSAHAAKLDPIVFNYHASQLDIVNNGHTIQANPADAGTIRLAGHDYKLVQFHFHAPSEMEIDGKRFPLVLHLVHQDASGRLAVVALLFTLGQENRTLKPLFENMPAKVGETKALPAHVNLADLLPAKRGYFTFTGSLTTPPCSEGVRWLVLEQPVTLSSRQLEAFRKLYPMNARPIQPLNGRQIQVTD